MLAASALEVFHAAALVHDDIMDNSDTRRGEPSVHRAFERSHAQRGWDGPPTRSAGRPRSCSATSSWAGATSSFDRGVRTLLALPTAGTAGRAEFNRMRTEVTAGQYLDILEEVAWRSHPGVRGTAAAPTG